MELAAAEAPRRGGRRAGKGKFDSATASACCMSLLGIPYFRTLSFPGMLTHGEGPSYPGCCTVPPHAVLHSSVCSTLAPARCSLQPSNPSLPRLRPLQLQ